MYPYPPLSGEWLCGTADIRRERTEKRVNFTSYNGIRATVQVFATGPVTRIGVVAPNLFHPESLISFASGFLWTDAGQILASPTRSRVNIVSEARIGICERKLCRGCVQTRLSLSPRRSHRDIFDNTNVTRYLSRCRRKTYERKKIRAYPTQKGERRRKTIRDYNVTRSSTYVRRGSSRQRDQVQVDERETRRAEKLCVLE